VLFLRSVIDGVAKIIKSNAEVYEGLIVGAVVVVAVALTQFRQAVRSGHRFFAGALGWVTVFNLALLAGVLGLVMTPAKSPDNPSPPSPFAVAGAVGGAALAVLLLVRLLEARRGRESKLS
jgi:ribose transport system permease protein/erythritol transport system permease protein